MAKNTTVAPVAPVAPVATVAPVAPVVVDVALAESHPIDVSDLKEITVPTFLQRIAAIDEQLATPGLFDLVKDALQKVKAAEIRKEARKLQAEIRVVRAMMPPRTPRVPRAPKAAKA